MDEEDNKPCIKRFRDVIEHYHTDEIALELFKLLRVYQPTVAADYLEQLLSDFEEGLPDPKDSMIEELNRRNK